MVKNVLNMILEAGSIDLAMAIFVSQGLVTSDDPARGIAEATQGQGC